MNFRNLLEEEGVKLVFIENAPNTIDYAPIDLSEATLEAKQIIPSNHQQLDTYLNKERLRTKAKVLYGGYLEKRNLYAKSALFNSESIRNIHLGVDFWATAGTGILSPLNAIVHSAHYNEGEGNYGGTIILKHCIKDFSFYSLYGHLSKASLNLQKGASVKKGKVFCALGNPQENGNYIPHLHFQWILNLPKDAVDYAGVCAESKIELFAKNSPQPQLYLS